MSMFRPALFLFLLLFIPVAFAKPLSDSLPIEGHYSQHGSSINRLKLERFLLAHDTSVELADRSIGYKWSGHVVGATLWCVNLGVNAYQLKLFLDALKKQNSIIDSTGKHEAFSNSLYKFSIPLAIGSDVASFVQSLLYNRSDYLLHKATLAFNASVAATGPALDIHIEKDKNGLYKQAGLLIREPVLFGVLREQGASRTSANWSVALKETGIHAGEWGGMYIALSLLSYLQESMGDTSVLVDKKARESNLKIGVSLAAFGIVNGIISTVMRNRAIKKYNAALPAPKATVVPAKNAVAPSDSAETGIIERPKNIAPDSTGTEKRERGK